MLTLQDIRPAQRRTIEELKSSLGVQAVLGMGAGKTVAALTAIRELIDAALIGSAIVLAPRRVARDTWPKEIKVWEHLKGMDLVLVSGDPARRKRILQETHEVYVVGIDNIVWLLEELDRMRPDDARRNLLVVDELSKLDDPRGKRAKAMLKASTKFGAIWGLTGTPRPNTEQDQWMPLQIISGGTAFDKAFDEWRRGWFRPEDRNGYNWSIHDFARPLLMRKVNEWSFTIPPGEVTDVPFNSGEGHDIFVDLSAEQERDLGTLDKKLLIELGIGDVELLRTPDDATLFAMMKAVAVGKMTQVLQGFVYQDGVTLQTYANPKIDALDDLLGSIGGEPTLICFHYKEDLDELRRLLGPTLPYLGDGVRDRDADRWINQWNDGALPHMALHPASAGHGLNLQFGGRRMVWYHPTWSAELYLQTVKRLARPGQPLPVYSHRIRARHWLEDLRINRVEGKVQEQADFIEIMRKI